MKQRLEENIQHRREQVRLAYAKSKSSIDAILLRLPLGHAARLDVACRAAGMGRTAFCREHLVSLLEAVAPRLADIERAGGLQTLIARALPPQLSNSPDPAAEFDALFNAK